jgi:hypothetical protein
MADDEYYRQENFKKDLAWDTAQNKRLRKDVRRLFDTGHKDAALTALGIPVPAQNQPAQPITQSDETQEVRNFWDALPELMENSGLKSGAELTLFAMSSIISNSSISSEGKLNLVKEVLRMFGDQDIQEAARALAADPESKAKQQALDKLVAAANKWPLPQ